MWNCRRRVKSSNASLAYQRIAKSLTPYDTSSPWFSTKPCPPGPTVFQRLNEASVPSKTASNPASTVVTLARGNTLAVSTFAVRRASATDGERADGKRVAPGQRDNRRGRVRGGLRRDRSLVQSLEDRGTGWAGLRAEPR